MGECNKIVYAYDFCFDQSTDDWLYVCMYLSLLISYLYTSVTNIHMHICVIYKMYFICLWIISSKKYFWSNVTRGTIYTTSSYFKGCTRNPAYSIICELEPHPMICCCTRQRKFPNQNIIWFQIKINDISLMQKCQSRCNLQNGYILMAN